MIFKSKFMEDSNAVNAARITGMQTSPDEEGTPLVQADFQEIKYWAYAGSEVVSGHNGVELDPAEVIFDDLQGWSKDDVGFNFKHNVPASAFPIGDIVNRIIYKFTNVDDDVAHLEFIGRVRQVLSS